MKPTSHWSSARNSMERLREASGAEEPGLEDIFSPRLSNDPAITPQQVKVADRAYGDLSSQRVEEFEAQLPEGWRKNPRNRNVYDVPGEGHQSPHLRGSAGSRPAEENPFVNPNTGEPAEHVYRWEGPEGLEAMQEHGALGATFGGATNKNPYTHVSLFPDNSYKEPGRRLLQIKANQPGHVNRVKERGYGVISAPISSEHVTDVTDTYDGPSYQSAQNWEQREPPDDWFETQALNRAYDITKVAVADSANEATKQIQEGVMTPAKGREFWRGMR